MKNEQPILLLLLAAMLLVGCRAVATPAASRPQAAATARATQQIQFSPESITPSAEQPVLAGECVASFRVPRAGAYSCTAETGAVFDPCFLLVQSGNLGCQPNPPAGRYSAIVKATNAPLPVVGSAPQPVSFYLSLEPGKPSCTLGVNSPMQSDGQEVTWRCEAPGAWLLGDLHTEGAEWLADYVVTDSSGATITYGPEATFVVKAWLC